MSGSARAGTISREAQLRAVNPEALQRALSRARPRHLCFSLDKDLHRGRQCRSDILTTVQQRLLSYVVFRHKQVLHIFDQVQMVWSWMFVQGGEHEAVVFGPTHGSEVGDYRLYDVKTGKLIAEIWGEEDTQTLKPNAPEWAKRLQDHLHNN